MDLVGDLASLDKTMAERMGGPVPVKAPVRILLAMTVVTGIVDAVSFLALGRVFTANMTGNLVLIGFAFAGAPGLSHLAIRCGVARILVRGCSRRANGLWGVQLASLGRPGVYIGSAPS
jgi:hypothetical protein